MPRIRTYKAELFTDHKTGRLSGDALKVLLGLWTHADDYGVIEYQPIELRVKILPFVADDSALGRLIKSEILPLRLAVLFDYDSKAYLWMPKFLKHQRINRPSLPLLEGWKETTTPDEYVSAHGSLTEHSSRIGVDRSGVERSGNGVERNGREGIGEGAPPASAGAAAAPPPGTDGEVRIPSNLTVIPPGLGDNPSIREVQKAMGLDSEGRDPKGNFLSKEEFQERRRKLAQQGKAVTR